MSHTSLTTPDFSGTKSAGTRGAMLLLNGKPGVKIWTLCVSVSSLVNRIVLPGGDDLDPGLKLEPTLIHQGYRPCRPVRRDRRNG